MKRAFVGLLAGVMLGGAASGYAMSQWNTVNVYPETGVFFKGIDFGCAYSRSDPSGKEVGPLLDCSRVSTSHSKNCRGRYVAISLYHITVTNWCPGLGRATTFPRSP
jgi:hypothetical protein